MFWQSGKFFLEALMVRAPRPDSATRGGREPYAGLMTSTPPM